jgi:hypothetical protein
VDRQRPLWVLLELGLQCYAQISVAAGTPDANFKLTPTKSKTLTEA